MGRYRDESGAVDLSDREVGIGAVTGRAARGAAGSVFADRSRHGDRVAYAHAGCRAGENEDPFRSSFVAIGRRILHEETGSTHRRDHSGHVAHRRVCQGRKVRAPLDIVNPRRGRPGVAWPRSPSSAGIAAVSIASVAPPSAGLPPSSRPHLCAGEAELRGTGAPTVKSAALSSLSEQPAPARSAAVAF